MPSDIGDAPPLPPQGLLQSLTRDREGRLAGYRIDRDGRYFSHPRGEGWVEDRILEPGQMAAVRSAIASSGVDGLHDLYRGEVYEEPATVLWVQIASPNGARTITVVGDRRVPELERLTEGLLEVFRTS